MKHAILIASVLEGTAALTVGKVQDLIDPKAFEDSCPNQKRFDALICKGFMCTRCTVPWCFERCQEIQLQYRGCRCSWWAPGTTYWDNRPGQAPKVPVTEEATTMAPTAIPTEIVPTAIPTVNAPTTLPTIAQTQKIPVPTAVRCTVITTVAYLLMLVELQIVRMYHNFTRIARGSLEAASQAAFQTLTYGPMLCVFFLAYRMHVEFLSDGNDQPQWWAQICMYVVTFAMLASMLMVFTMTLVLGKQKRIREGELIGSDFMKDMTRKHLASTLSGVRYTILLLLYGGLAALVVGVFLYRPPPGMVALPNPAPAIYCIIALTTVFFSAEIIIAACRTVSELTGRDTESTVSMLVGAASTVEFGPMLSVLFLAARMRALQHASEPQPWAQRSMLIATGAISFTTLLAVAVPLVHGGIVLKESAATSPRFTVPNGFDRISSITLIWLRYLTLVTFYAGTICVIISIFTYQSPAGPAHTLPISPTVQCVIILTLEFFSIYFAQTVLLAISQLTQGKCPMHTYSCYRALEATKATTHFAPMLAILCVATRMYALLITDNKGTSPYWVQYAMFLATWSLVISALVCFGTGVAQRSVDQDEDGNIVSKFENKSLASAVLASRYCCMLMFCGGIIAIVAGLFLMQPETATGGWQFLTLAARAFNPEAGILISPWF